VSDSELECLVESQRLCPWETWTSFFSLIYYVTGCQINQDLEQCQSSKERALWTCKKFADWRHRISGDDKEVKRMQNVQSTIWHGQDKFDRVICWIRPMLWPTGFEILDIARYYQASIDEGCELADSLEKKWEAGVPNFAVVYDRRGMSFWKSRENAADCRRAMTRYGPEFGQVFMDMWYNRFGTYYILGASWIYWAYWKVAQPFLSSEARNMMQILDRPEDLLHYMDISQVPEPWHSEICGSDL